MNIDDLKDAWNNDEPQGLHLPDNTAMLGKTNSAIGWIRKNMRNEFIGTLVSYCVNLSLLFGRPQIPFLFNLCSILFFTLFVINCYYFSRFYLFYKSISRYDFNIKESIRKVVYELDLNTEIYKTYSISVAPLAVLITITLICSHTTSNFMQHLVAADTYISTGNMLLIFLVIVISFIPTYFGINFHVRLQYGKYINALKQVLDDLGNEG